jgi:putative hemolysin
MLEFFIILFCLIINGVLACTETAFIAINKQTLKSLTKKGDEKAKLLLLLRDNPARTLSTIQIGITFVGAFAAAIGGAGVEEYLSPWLKQTFGTSSALAEFFSIFFIVIPLTYTNVVLGELVPKILALQRPLFVASLTAPWLSFAIRVFAPIVYLFERSAKKIIDLFLKQQISTEETENSSVEGLLTPLNKQYIMNMVKIEQTTVKEIMVEWEDVEFITTEDSIEKVEQVLIFSGHTRVPIVEKDGRVTGILNSKEFFAFQKTKSKEWLSLRRPAVYLQERCLILTALRLLQEQKAHMAIVLSSSQKTGIVTMEAIFEEIVGDIYDEDDDGAIQKILNRSSW